MPLDREQYLAQPKATWPAPPEDRRDTRHFVSAPDSLHLEAHVPGNQYYRFPERPVRYAHQDAAPVLVPDRRRHRGRMPAPGSPSTRTPRPPGRSSTDGGHEERLTTVGRWVKVERVFRTEPEATTLALDFRIATPTTPTVGEMWIDDVSLEPVGAASADP